MPAKTPIYLKATNGRKGKKCRLRDILSPDMISPPLGDFRHTVHIGKGGEQDAFGDMSFLQGKYELLPGKSERTVPQCHSEFLRANSTSEASSLETPSPVLKNAISLPTIGGSQALTLPLISIMPMPPNPDSFDCERLPPSNFLNKSNDLEPNTLLLSLNVLGSNLAEETTSTSSFLPNVFEKQKETPKLKSVGKAVSRENGFTVRSYHSNGNGAIHFGKKCSENYSHWLESKNKEEDGINPFQYDVLAKEQHVAQDSISKINGSMLSLELDLGPSILDEVLNIMDRPKTEVQP
ncbi:cdc42 effector protein 3 [Brienomyrus brachyistius]|uniref:cdc42 effector protein 3 n=1 Tax=Brienomyrus brachyistius TaxID=42636 RepID=UPI0020B33A93|nr:cdc42 effector protein 3 [Brienomyrus brachyistius]XP_048863932.1 cdc42 effector protein 3 [Brienomyrus brachyistius]